MPSPPLNTCIVSLLLSSLVRAHQPCSYSQANYSLQWNYVPHSDRIIFTIQTNAVDDDHFLTGFAISAISDVLLSVLNQLGYFDRARSKCIVSLSADLGTTDKWFELLTALPAGGYC